MKASENETVTEIVKEMHGYPLCWLTSEGIPQMSYDNEELSKYADRIEAAHRREILVERHLAEEYLAAKDAEIANWRTQALREDAVANVLREQCDVTVRADNSAVIAELQRRLKVAEDALDFAWMYADKLPHQWPLPERVRTKMRNALAAIREETKTKGE